MSTKIKFEHEAQVGQDRFNIGEWFIDEFGDLCSLCHTNKGNCVMIYNDTSPLHGERIKGSPYSCNNRVSISFEEFEKLIGVPPNEWKRVMVEITTKPYQP